MATPAAITYSPLACPICITEHADFTPAASHTWHGHAVTTNPARPNEKVIHGICEACFPSVPAASRSKCPFCRSAFPSGAPEKFKVKPDGTLDSTAPTIGADTEEAADERSPLRRRAIAALHITTDTDEVALEPGTTGRQTNTPLWKKIVVGTSVALIPAGLITFAVVVVVCPPAAALITLNVFVATTLASATTLAVIDCDSNPRTGTGTQNYGRFSPGSPISLG